MVDSYADKLLIGLSDEENEMLKAICVVSAIQSHHQPTKSLQCTYIFSLLFTKF